LQNPLAASKGVLSSTSHILLLRLLSLLRITSPLMTELNYAVPQTQVRGPSAIRSKKKSNTLLKEYLSPLINTRTTSYHPGMSTFLAIPLARL
jgi:hypothetical protein